MIVLLILSVIFATIAVANFLKNHESCVSVQRDGDWIIVRPKEDGDGS